ncbi:MAG: hypothetical protein JWQ71_1233 [Pedosphaera sp.]|nr:hypothetical protein [Pedosphaera sp.]
MMRYFDQLMKLRPQERRWLVVGSLVIFIVLNFWFVYPHFHDWSKATLSMEKSEATLKKFRAELAHQREYEAKIRDLEAGGGTAVMLEDQAIDFERTYRSKANEYGVLITGNSPLVTHTNDQFFLERVMTITALTTEKQLVDFLYSLGAGSSMMRVRELSLRPDPSHQQLSGNITIVASYQKKPPAKPAVPVKAVAAAEPVKKTVPKPVPAPATNKPAPAGAKIISNNNKTGTTKR